MVSRLPREHGQVQLLVPGCSYCGAYFGWQHLKAQRKMRGTGIELPWKRDGSIIDVFGIFLGDSNNKNGDLTSTTASFIGWNVGMGHLWFIPYFGEMNIHKSQLFFFWCVFIRWSRFAKTIILGTVSYWRNGITDGISMNQHLKGNVALLNNLNTSCWWTSPMVLLTQMSMHKGWTNCFDGQHGQTIPWSMVQMSKKVVSELISKSDVSFPPLVLFDSTISKFFRRETTWNVMKHSTFSTHLETWVCLKIGYPKNPMVNPC